MNATNYLSKSRGIKNLSLRIFSIVSRFGLTSRKFDYLMRKFGRVTSDLGCVPTFAITAVTLKRNPKVVRELCQNGVEFAIHGYIHTDYGVVPMDEQVRHFQQAIDTFQMCHVPYTGFRAPFLRINGKTPKALRSFGFPYDSSHSVHWDVLDRDSYTDDMWHEYERLLSFYNSRTDCKYIALPRVDDGLVEIPVSIPDDEALIERLGVTQGERIGAIWGEMLQRTYDRGELFTLQLHPERIDLCESALANVIQRAKCCTPSIWVASLREISEWWQEKDQFAFDVYHESRNRYKVKADCTDRASVLVKNCETDVSADEWFDGYKIVNAREFCIETPTRPSIRVSKDTAPAVFSFLRNEGYVVESDVRDGDCGIYLDDLDRFTEIDEKPLLERIEKSQAPLLRFWRWPDRSKSAVSVTGDIDAITLVDFGLRILENWRQNGKNNGNGRNGKHR